MNQRQRKALSELRGVLLETVADDGTEMPHAAVAHALLAIGNVDQVSFHELLVQPARVRVRLWPDATHEVEMARASELHGREHPLIRRHLTGGWSRPFTPEEVSTGWRRSWAYHHIRSRWGISEQLAMPLPRAGATLRSIALGRGGTSFSHAERDATGEAWRAILAADRALQRVARLQRHLTTTSPSLPLGSISVREREVIAALSEGGSRRVVARQLGVSVATVNKHVQNVNGKLGTGSYLQAARRLQVLARPSA